MSGDLISRSALIAAIVEERNKIPLRVPCAPYELLDDKPYAAGQNKRGGIRKALRCVNDAPAVDAVEVVHGKWVFSDFASPTLECSVCGGLAPWNIVDDYHSERTNFCPNCGAKMDGERKDDNENLFLYPQRSSNSYAVKSKSRRNY